MTENPAPEGRTSLAQRFSAGEAGKNDSSPGGTTQFSRTLSRGIWFRRKRRPDTKREFVRQPDKSRSLSTSLHQKIVSRDELQQRVASCRRASDRITLANRCFDL